MEPGATVLGVYSSEPEGHLSNNHKSISSAVKGKARYLLGVCGENTLPALGKKKEGLYLEMGGWQESLWQWERFAQKAQSRKAQGSLKERKLMASE